MDREREVGLVRGLGPWAASSIVVGTIIGTGVFLKTGRMAESGAALWVLAAWGAAGLLSFTGALTYAELGAMFPKAGGEYIYAREGYGALAGYLYAWNRFWIATPGSVAAYAVGTSTFLGDWLPEAWRTRVSVAIIAAFTGLNCLNVRAGGGVQTALTALKVAMIAALAFGALVLAPHGDFARVVDAGAGFPGWSAFATMMVAALWAYDGWNNLPMAAGEVRDPTKNFPRAMVWGMACVLAIYGLVNVGYYHALPGDAVAGDGSVAQRTAATFLGEPAQLALAIAMAISAISAMNGSILTGARVPYAVAADGLAPRALAKLDPQSRVPVNAVMVQGVISCLFARIGDFDDLTDMVVVVSWVFYALNAGAVIVLRVRHPDRERPFRVPGYPVVPVIFIAIAGLMLVNAAWSKPLLSLYGLVFTAVGAAVFYATRSVKR